MLVLIEVFLRHQGRETTKNKDKLIKILKKGYKLIKI